MKYLVLHAEGLLDRAYPDLGGKTPLQAADTPNLDALARAGEFGLMTVQTPGSPQSLDVTTLGLLGYDPRKYPNGPAPFEAVGLGVGLGDQDVAFRCDMVTLVPAGDRSKSGSRYPEIKKFGPQLVLEDDTAGGIDTDEARELIDAINEQLGSEAVQFYPGSGSRHFMVWVGGKAKAGCSDPRELIGRQIGDFLPGGDGADVLRKLMEASLVILGTHPVNDQRLEAGLKPANGVWLWGQGKAPKLPNLSDRFQIDGSVVSGADLVRGIGVCAGLQGVSAENLGGEVSAALSAQANRALRELEKKDFVYLHVETPPPSSEGGNGKSRCGTVEEFDRRVVGVILEGLKRMGPSRVLLVGDRHGTTKGRGEPSTPGLYALSQGEAKDATSSHRGFSEAEAAGLRGNIRDCSKLLAKLVAKS